LPPNTLVEYGIVDVVTRGASQMPLNRQYANHNSIATTLMKSGLMVAMSGQQPGRSHQRMSLLLH